MSGLAVAGTLIATWTLATLWAGLGSLNSGGKNNALPVMWVLAGIAWIVFWSVGITLSIVEIYS